MGTNVIPNRSTVFGPEIETQVKMQLTSEVSTHPVVASTGLMPQPFHLLRRGPGCDNRSFLVLQGDTFKIFERRGFKVHDFWLEANGSGHLWYVLEWQSAEQMESEWIKFKSDEEWQSVKGESEKDGPIVEKINVIVLKRVA
jgi:hypothetical protein